MSPSPETLLEARDVTLAYGSHPALRGASLTIAAGEAVALVGPSGSGKSSLLMCLAGVLRPDSGTVRYGDAVVSSLSDAERRRFRAESLGFVLQFADLLPELTLLENAALPGLMRGGSRRDALPEARARLAAMAVDHLADRFPGAVSGGERQRAAIARALVGKPGLVLADEPTGALDSDNSRVAMDLLLNQAREAGAAVLVVTHDTTRLERFDRVVTIIDGACSAATTTAAGTTAPTGTRP